MLGKTKIKRLYKVYTENHWLITNKVVLFTRVSAQRSSSPLFKNKI